MIFEDKKTKNIIRLVSNYIDEETIIANYQHKTDEFENVSIVLMCTVHTHTHIDIVEKIVMYIYKRDSN